MKEVVLHEIRAYQGTSIVDPREVSQYLLSLDRDSSRRSQDPTISQYEDIIISPENLPGCIDILLKDALRQLSNQMKCNLEIIWPMWTIIHDKHDSTFPHSHDNAPNSWAFVYWAKVPKGSGKLSYYPMGLPGGEKYVEPVEGDFLLFPGPILHAVRRNTSNKPRISLSTNILAT